MKKNLEIFEKIAANNNVSVNEVIEEINKAIDLAWSKNPKNVLNPLFENGKPTAEEFIIKLALRTKAQSNIA